MKGDFTRLTHDPAKHYSKVREQQGRGLLDADFNEQGDITEHRAALTATDVIGRTGFPKGDDFKVEALAAGTIQILPGRAYVDGILCQLGEPGGAAIAYGSQPDLPGAPAISPTVGRRDMVYLDVWERHITAQQDPEIKEPALGGADTASRVKIVAQVRVQTALPQNQACATWTPPAASGGTLTTLLDQTGSEEDLCSPLPSSAFRGLENRLYRVEIHEGGALGAATFKWSRDNGSVTFPVESFDGTDTVKLVRLGRDPMLSIADEQWAEVVTDESELLGGAGTFAQVDKVTASTRTLQFKSAIDAQKNGTHPIVRRWDGPLQNVTANEVELEDGIKIKFGGSDFKTGDYWLFTARTVGEGGLEILSDAPPHGVVHHYAPLAILTWSQVAQNWIANVDDCRRKQWFPPLTAITAEDVKFSSNVCKFGPAVDTVQKALEELCKQDHEGCSIVVKPGPEWWKVFDRIKATDNASICFRAGEYAWTDTKPKTVVGRNLKISGAGAGTRIVATKGECALLFENCASVTVRDLYAEARVATARGDMRHLNGVLSFRNCRSVSLSGLHVQCAHAAVRAVACLTINNKPVSGDADRALISVEDCELRVGDQQVGLLIVNAQRASVRDNRIRVLPAPQRWQQFFHIKMENHAARKAVTSAMVSGLQLVDKEAEAKKKAADDAAKLTRGATPAPAPGTPAVISTPGGNQQPAPPPASKPRTPKAGTRPPLLARGQNVRVPVTDKFELRFAAEPKIAEVLRGAIDPKLLTDQRKATDLMQRTTAKFVLEKEKAPAEIQAWLNDVAQTTCASQGIVIAGTEVIEAIVEDNTIIGAAQAIHVGVSHENPLKQAARVDRMERVTVTGNDIHVYAVVGYTRSRHAIFVGNADSIVVRENYAKITRFTGMLDQPIEGIRVFGYFGRYVSVRENHLAAIQPNAQQALSRFDVGILFELRGAAPQKKPMWQIKDNLAERTDPPVKSNHTAVVSEGNFA